MTKSGPQREESTVYHTHNYRDTNEDCRKYKKDMFEPRGLLELERDLYHEVSVLKKNNKRAAVIIAGSNEVWERYINEIKDYLSALLRFGS